MLAHPFVKFSTNPAELPRACRVNACNRWLQCGLMRIELPSASWTDTMLRAEDDAHTLTVAPQQPADWFGGWLTETGFALRTEVADVEPRTVTLTL